MFTRILIANRGEIACQVITTAQRLGLHAVAVYSDADAKAKHVHLADSAYHIGASPSRDSYLDIDKIISTAKQARVDAIHPGYGFLSENPQFAQACADAGIIFIGPSANAIDSMGSKATAKQIMRNAGVPVIPGYDEVDQALATLTNAAHDIGFPLLIKASAGGGGKGMRLVHHATDFESALQAAKREAESSFANDHVILEKFLPSSRHIEIQILADTHGNVIYCFERDCSLQRRKQKVIEEAPAANFDAALRQQMGEAAIQAAKAIGYVGAGTIEFMLAADNQFYFMEMNTRLQVEYAVSECITQIPLIEAQLNIAAGDALPYQQDELSIHGHAIEARIYAEDPNHDFAPSIGTISVFRTPTDARVDSGVRANDNISMFYDPMIAKLIVHAPTRHQAIQKLHHALREFHIAGVQTNIPFLLNLCKQNAFIAGTATTQTIEQEMETLTTFNQSELPVALALAAAVKLTQAGSSKGPWEQSDAWRIHQPGWHDFTFFAAGQDRHCRIQFRQQQFYSKDIGEFSIHVLSDIHYQFSHQGHTQPFSAIQTDTSIIIRLNDQQFTFSKIDWQQRYQQQDNAGGHLQAPMPGTVVAVLASDGQEVERGDGLIVIEAMKMEHTIHAPSAGTVKAIHYHVGDQVNEGEELVAFEAQG